MLRPPVKTSRHLDMKITCFGQVSFPPEGFVWRFCLSRLLLRFPRSNPSRSQPGMNRHPKATHQWLLMGRLNNPLACFVLQLTGTSKAIQWLHGPLEMLLRRFPSSNPSRSQPGHEKYTLWASKFSHPEWLCMGRLKQGPWLRFPAANTHLARPAQQWLQWPHRLNIPLACFILQPTGTPRPHINGFFGLQACRLPALRPLKPSKPSKRFKPLKPLKRWLGMLHPAGNSHPEATHQWLLMGRWNNPLACFILQPTGTPRPHINGFLWAA